MPKRVREQLGVVDQGREGNPPGQTTARQVKDILPEALDELEVQNRHPVRSLVNNP